MNTNISREIAKKKARVSYLVTLVHDNAHPTLQLFEGGFFTAAAEQFRTFAGHAEEITRLHGEIMQLSFDLERIQSEQSELTFSPAHA